MTYLEAKRCARAKIGFFGGFCDFFGTFENPLVLDGKLAILLVLVFKDKKSVLNRAAKAAVEWARANKATFEDSKTELIHHSPRRANLSDYCVSFNGIIIRPSEVIKWIGVFVDSKLTGLEHIKARAASAARALNTSLALTHVIWGLKISSHLWADYCVSSFFFPLPAAALKPLERVNKCMHGVLRADTGRHLAQHWKRKQQFFRLPYASRERCYSTLLATLSQHRTALPPFYVTPSAPPLVRLTAPHRYTLWNASRSFAGQWMSLLAAAGARVRKRLNSFPMDATTDPRADQDGSGARGKRGGAVSEHNALGLSPPPGGRHVPI
ncbi:hypothetical protein B0H19DRAFT_1286223 [Mycena capillaripes]|nr:hypothetical protein B0H19DRAFT_1286223 [Mycena capillaripes]